MVAGLDLGISMNELKEMPWGRLVMLLQARAQQYEDSDAKSDYRPREVSGKKFASLFGIDID